MESLGSYIADKLERKGLSKSWQQDNTEMTSSWMSTSVVTEVKLWRNFNNTGLLLLTKQKFQLITQSITLPNFIYVQLVTT